MSKKNQNKKFKLNGLEDLYGSDIGDLISSIQISENTPELKNDIPLSEIKINKDQPRKVFDDETINELAESLKEVGLIQPIVLTKDNVIIAGERRFRAAKKLKWNSIPALVLDLSKQQIDEFAIVENIQREDLLPIEEAVAYNSLIEKYNFKQEDVAKRVGKSRSHIANILRLLNLPDYIRQAMLNNEISMGQAKPLLSILSREEKLRQIFNNIIEKNLTARQVEEIINKLDNTKKEKKLVKKSHDIEYLEGKLTQKLKTPVFISNNKILIKFNNNTDLNRILEILNLLDD